ncbi:hypothetical protein F2Q68_00008941 [Brassica cretica]|uniref:Uncharacterized protein n=1 Tax=Brassica cretica TaxID=69181 RepID=A0A8S9KPX3_BRACR|nr:hypothetical protein F2Q68_00008941 [Brassica cretica]
MSFITKYPSPQLQSSVLLTVTFGPSSLQSDNERTLPLSHVELAAITDLHRSFLAPLCFSFLCHSGAL